MLDRWVGALDSARELLLDTSRDSLSRLCAAWPHLQHLDLMDLPSQLRPHWSLVSERTARLSAVAEESRALVDLEEAGDVGTTLLCLEWLLRRNLIPATGFADETSLEVSRREGSAQA